MNTTTHAPFYVFDLDGVITHPHNSSVDKNAVGHIAQLLDQGDYIAINTGRSYAWVKEFFLKELTQASESRNFTHLFIACEKGGESIKWLDNQFVPQPSRFALAASVRSQVLRFFESHANQFPTMFWDDTKTTMATIEKHPHAQLDQFRDEQRQLTAMLRQIIPTDSIRIDPTTIATDIESDQAGKHAGAELVHEWAHSLPDVESDHYISFGDSKSDYEMARYFAATGNSSTFIFVGNKNETFDQHDGVTLIRTVAEYAHGTNEYFGLPNHA